MSVQNEIQTTTKTSLRINTNVFWSLKRLALDQRKSIAELADEAFRDLLKKYRYTHPQS